MKSYQYLFISLSVVGSLLNVSCVTVSQNQGQNQEQTQAQAQAQAPKAQAQAQAPTPAPAQAQVQAQAQTQPTTPTPTRATLSLQITNAADDCAARSNSTSWEFINTITTMPEEAVGRWSATDYRQVTGMRFRNVSIPKGAVITSATITFVSDQTNTAGAVNTRFIGQAEDNPAAFTTLADLQARRGTIMGGNDNTHITSAQVTWDSIPVWNVNTSYISPNISTIVQEIVRRPGWASGNAMVIFWDDAEGRSVGDKAVRSAFSYDGSTSKAPILNISYYIP